METPAVDQAPKRLGRPKKYATDEERRQAAREQRANYKKRNVNKIKEDYKKKRLLKLQQKLEKLKLELCEA